ncbi:hypothetical protein IAT38_004966 [Cryptococcus sp. DSM 104549]
MLFSKSAILASILALAGASAADYRLLLNKPDCVTMDNFAANFRKLCPVFDTTGTGTQRGELFRPGDFQGKNNDTQALAFCTYVSNVDASVYTVTRELAESLGGTVA